MSSKHSTVSVIAVLSLTSLALAACSGPAADPPQPTGTDAEFDLANDEDFQRLVEAAQSEGSVVWYTSVPSGPADLIGAAFEQEYGIPVTVTRSGGEDLLQRFMLEADSGRVMNDLLSISDPASFITLTEQGYFRCFKPRLWDELHEWAQDTANECWTANRALAMVIGYRIDLLEELNVEPPTSWEDLNNPALRGRVAHANPNFSSSIGIVTTMLSEDMGWDWYTDFRNNDPLIMRGNAQMFDALETGEAVVSAFSTQGRFQESRLEGGNLDMSVPSEGLYLIAAPSSVPAEAPNPHAGMLLADFLLTDAAQQILLEDAQYVSRADFDAPEGMPNLNDLVIASIDYEWVVANIEERVGQFTELLEAEVAD